MIVIFLRTLWGLVSRYAAAVIGAGSIGAAEQSTKPHHLVVIGM